jgi:FkbM family methyltransferase
MSRVIIDLAAKRQGASSTGPLEHPAGITLPFDSPSDAALIIPEIRSEIRAGSYAADVLQLLPKAVQFGDRALIIGAGLGVMSTMVARSEGIDRVIAVEANTSLIPYLNRVHELNKVSEIETVNAVLADGKKGRVPFFARRDLRTSSLVPHDRSWQQVMMVPFMDLNLILKEEQISLIICDIPVASAQLLARAELDSVERILVNCCDDADQAWDEDGVCTLLAARGYTYETVGTAVLFHRAGTSDRAASQPGKGMAASIAEMAANDTDMPDDDQFPEDEFLEDELLEDETAGDETAGDETAGGLQTDEQPVGNQLDGGQQDGKRNTAARQNGGTVAPETSGSLASRLWWLIALSLFMALPLILISEIADNRAGRRVAVTQEIGAAWGGAQTLTGPFIVIPVETRGDKARAAPLVLLPEVLKIDSELKYRSIAATTRSGSTSIRRALPAGRPLTPAGTGFWRRMKWCCGRKRCWGWASPNPGRCGAGCHSTSARAEGARRSVSNQAPLIPACSTHHPRPRRWPASMFLSATPAPIPRGGASHWIWMARSSSC